MSNDDLRTLMRDATADAPSHDFPVERIAGMAHARTQRRRLWYGVAGVGAAAAVLAVVSVGANLGSPAADTPLAGPSAPADPSPSGPVDPGAISLPSSLPLGEAVAVVDAALPSGYSVGELPMDAAWTSDGGLALPLVTPNGDATLTLSAGAGGCSADSAALEASTLDAVASGICTAKAAYPNEPGTVVDSGPVNPAA
jgi:hypothetical protein